MCAALQWTHYSKCLLCVNSLLWTVGKTKPGRRRSGSCGILLLNTAHLHWNLLRLWTSVIDSSPFCPKLLSRVLRLSRDQTIPKSVPRRHWGAFIKCLLWLDTLLNNHKPNINHFNLKPTSAIEMLEYQINVILSWYYYSYCSFSRHLSKVTSSKWGVWEKHICLFPMRKIEKVKIKNPNHIINLCLSVWRHVHRWVSGET